MTGLFSEEELDWINKNQDIINAEDHKAIYHKLVYDVDRGNTFCLNVKLTVLIRYLNKDWGSFTFEKPDTPGGGWYSLSCKITPEPGQSYTVSSFHTDETLTDAEIVNSFIRALHRTFGKFPKYEEIIKEIIKHFLNI